MPNTALKTFIIYARDDKAHKDDLLRHLTPLQKAKILEVWHDGDIAPGEEWEIAIKHNLKKSDIVLVLVTVNCLNSHFIQTDELEMAFLQVQEGHSKIIPIVVAPCMWELSPIFENLQGLPEDLKPITTWNNKDEAWTNVMKGIAKTVEQIQTQKDSNPLKELHSPPKSNSTPSLYSNRSSPIFWIGIALFCFICIGFGLWEINTRQTAKEQYVLGKEAEENKEYELIKSEIKEGKNLSAKKEWNMAFFLLYKHRESAIFDSSAQFYLGRMYHKGDGVKEDKLEAIKWYKKAAEQGHASAQNNLGYMYLNSEGTKQNYTEALKWYIKAVEEHNPNAQCSLGYMYENGYGVTKNKAEAIRLYRLSAKQGNKVAQDNLKNLGETW